MPRPWSFRRRCRGDRRAVSSHHLDRQSSRLLRGANSSRGRGPGSAGGSPAHPRSQERRLTRGPGSAGGPPAQNRVSPSRIEAIRQGHGLTIDKPRSASPSWSAGIKLRTLPSGGCMAPIDRQALATRLMQKGLRSRANTADR